MQIMKNLAQKSPSSDSDTDNIETFMMKYYIPILTILVFQKFTRYIHTYY